MSKFTSLLGKLALHSSRLALALTVLSLLWALSYPKYSRLPLAVALLAGQIGIVVGLATWGMQSLLEKSQPGFAVEKVVADLQQGQRFGLGKHAAWSVFFLGVLTLAVLLGALFGLVGAIFVWRIS